MTLARAWTLATSAAPSTLHDPCATLKRLLEPAYPACAFYDHHKQCPKPLPQAIQALQELEQHSAAIASTSKDARSRAQIIEDLVEWYLERCEITFLPICSELLAPLRSRCSPDSYALVPAVLDKLRQWMNTCVSPLLPDGLMASPSAAKAFLLRFHVRLRLQIDGTILELVRTYLIRTIPLQEGSLAQAEIDALASSAEALGLSAMLLTLLTSVLHSEVSRKVLVSVAGHSAQQRDEVWALEEPARERLVRWLDREAKPRFHSILQRCAHKAGAAAGATEPDAMDVGDEAERIVEDEFSDEGTWESRLDFHLDRTLCSVRASQLFDLIAIYPDSIAALEDLQISLERTDDKLLVADALSESLQTRLLHPGAHTRDIIQIYVHMVRALRDVDQSGVVLSRVVSPLRRYLRGRQDTIAVIVSSLLGEDAKFTLLKDELEAADAESADEADTSATRQRRRRRQSMAKHGGSRKRHNAGDGGGGRDGYSSGSSCDSDYQDPDWQPKPVDAGREYRLSTSRDMIGMLISIFDDRAGFISALEKSMADQLVRVRGYRATREHRNNMILKKRFGDKNMGKCDVMLGDISESRRVDGAVHGKVERERRNYATMATITREEREQQRGTNEVLDALHPLVLSRQFWPDLSSSSSTARPTSTSTNTTTTNTSTATSTTPSATMGGVATLPNLPPRFSDALNRYNTTFKTCKAMRRLEFLHHLSSIDLELTFQDSRQITVECSVLDASIVEVVANTAKQHDFVSVDQIVEQLGVQRQDVKRSLNFWSAHRVIGEKGMDVYEVVERLMDEEERDAPRE